MIKHRIDQVLKLSNRKTESDVFDLAELKANFRFEPQNVCKSGEYEDFKKLISNFVTELKQYISVNDQYCKAKFNEEKAKVRISLSILGEKTKD